MAEFFHMGGYGGFVWPAYAVTAILMLVLIVHALLDWRTQKRLLAMLEGEGEGRLRAPARERSIQHSRNES